MGDKNTHCDNSLLCVRCHTGCSMKIISCNPHSSPQLGKFTLLIVLMRPLKHREVSYLPKLTQLVAGGNGCFITWAWSVSSLNPSKPFPSLSRDHLGYRLLREGSKL